MATGQKKVSELEKIAEVKMFCPWYAHGYECTNCYTVALYILGCFDDEDFKDFFSLKELETQEAAEMLKDNFKEVKKEDIPFDYNLDNSEDRYLLVMGDPESPEHFAVIVDMKSEKPFFSQWGSEGCDYDSLKELMNGFKGKNVKSLEDVYYFKKK